MKDGKPQIFCDQWDKIQDHTFQDHTFFFIFYFFTDGLENGIAAQYPWGGYLFGILQHGLSVSLVSGNVMAKP